MKRIHPKEVSICQRDGCGREFIPRHPTGPKNANKYCSRECFNIGRLKPRIEGDCIQCGKHFISKYPITHWLYNNKIKRQYCSTECRLKGKPKVDRKCLQCGKPFQLGPSFVKHNAAKYCSKECQFARMRGNNSPFYDDKARIEKTCKVCKKIFTRERWRYNQKNHTGDFCSKKCHYKFVENPLAPLPPRQQKEYVRIRKIYMANHLACEKCGSIKQLELDHIQPIALYPELFKESSNFQTLCKECHKVKTKQDIRHVLAVRKLLY